MQTEIELLEELENNLKQYPIELIIGDLTRSCWNPVNASDEKKRKILTAAPWLVYIAIAKNVKENTEKYNKNPEYLEWSDKFWTLLDRLLKPKEYCEKLVRPLILADNKCLVEEFSNYLQRKAKKKSDAEKNYIKNLCFLSKESKVDIFPCLTFAANTNIKNVEIETKYSGENPYFPILIRSWSIANHLTDLLKENAHFKNFIDEKNIDCASIKEFHEMLFAIYELFHNSNGIIDSHTLVDSLSSLKCISIEECEQKSFSERILAFISRFMSSSKEDVEVCYEELKKSLIRKETLLLKKNPFYDKPVFKATLGDREKYICISPYLLLIRIGTIFSALLHQYNQERLREDSSKESYVKEVNEKVGDAYEDYIESVLAHYSNVYKFSYQEYRGQSGADFSIETKNYIFIIECKNGVGLRDPFYKDYLSAETPHPLLNSWNRICKGFSQCFNRAENFFSRNKKIFCLVVINETSLAEIAAFGMYIYHAKELKDSFFAKFEFGKFSMISLSMLDYLIASDELEEFAQDCEKNAKMPINSDDERYDKICKVLNIMCERKNVDNFDSSFWEKQLESLYQKRVS